MIKRRYIVAWTNDGKTRASEFTNKRDRDKLARELVAQATVTFVEVYTSTRDEGGSCFKTIKGVRPTFNPSEEN